LQANFDAGLGLKPCIILPGLFEQLCRWYSLGKTPKRHAAQFRQQRRFPTFVLAFLRWINFCDTHKMPVNRGVQFVFWNIGILRKHTQLLDLYRVLPVVAGTCDEIHLAVGNNAWIVFEVHVYKAVRRFADVGAVGVAAYADDAVDEVTPSVQAVDAFEPVDDPLVGIHREDAVGVAVGEQHRPRRHQCSDPRPGPLERVVQKHAVAMPVDYAVGNVRGQISHSADRHGNARALIGGSYPKRCRPAAAYSCYSNPLRIDVGSADKIVYAADSIKALDTGRGVTARVPPPATFTVRTVVNSCDLTQLQRIQHKAYISVTGEPYPVRLVCCFVAVSPPVGMPTYIENRRQTLPGGDFRGPV
jgi:hypothetical protein